MKLRNTIYRIIYSPVINKILRNLNKALHFAFPKVKLPPSGIIRIHLHNRSLLRFKTNQTDFVGFCIFWNGVYNYEYIGLFEKIIEKCKGFVDIGANGGLYSLVAGIITENINILAFDPTPAAVYFLNQNIRLNHLTAKIEAYPFALSDKTGETVFFEVKNKKYPYLKYNLGGSSSLVNYPPEFNRITVQTCTLDAFLQSYSRENLQIDFIKIDAEGAEPIIIEGMLETIRRYHPIIVCELLPDETGKHLEGLFLQLNYAFYMHEKDRLVPVKTLQQSNCKNVRNCFFVHSSKLFMIEEFI